MRIAQVAPCWFSIPPARYGGIEYVVSLLTDGLVERGHDVTLFASGDSVTKARLRPYFDKGLGDGAIESPVLELPHLLAAYLHAERYDIFHDHTTFGIGPALGSLISRADVVHTVHSPVNETAYVRETLEQINGRVHLVALSDAQRANSPNLRYLATIHNGIPLDRFPFRAQKDDYLLFLGRMCEQKGAHLAVQAARSSGRRLLMGFKMHEREEHAYFEAEVKPLLTPEVELLGELGFQEKVDVLAHAACTLMPLQWNEPFGLVAIESLACGTPVVGLRRGALPEIIEPEVTGVLAENMGEFVAGIERAAILDPVACRASVEARFKVGRMVEAYEQLFERVRASRAGSFPREPVEPTRGRPRPPPTTQGEIGGAKR